VSKERRLGRGLEALLGRPLNSDSAEPELVTPRVARFAEMHHVPDDVAGNSAPGHEAARTLQPSDGGLVAINVYEVESNPFQPRTEFDKGGIAELSASIKEHGLIQPLVVRRVAGRYQLISGERRLRAAIMAGLAEVPAQVREADDRQVAEIAIAENLQRRDLGPLEKAVSFQQYLDRYQATQEELAQRLGIDRSTIAILIRLLELPDAIQAALRSGAITQGHARALLPLGDEREQVVFCQRITAESLSVRATEELVQQTIHAADAEPLGHDMPAAAGRDGKATKPTKRNAQLVALEQELKRALGMKVELKQTAGGRGKLTIHFGSHDEFERLHEQLSGQKLRSRAG
jgi:ParB family transcriptional regulator, chromosome partitioning protein